MRKFAADNLMFLREEYPEIYKLIRGKSYDQAAIRPEIAKNGEPIASVVTESGSWQSLYSRYNPSLEADRWAQSLADAVSETKDVLFCGFGLGYHLEAFLKLYPEKRVYLYEPHLDTLLSALEVRDLRPILKSRKIAMFGVGSDLKTQIDFVESVFNTSSQTIRLIETPVYKLVYPELINGYRRIISQTAASAISSYRTLARFRKDWARNLIRNIAFNLHTPSLKGMNGVCKGVPAIVVGSGPSLEMEKESLRLLKNHALIIAAGTSIMALRKYGIEPDLVVSIDPGWHNYNAFSKVDMTRTPLLYVPTVHSGILKIENQYMMHAFFNLDAPTTYLMGLTNEDPIFASTATVSGTAIQAAIYLGCSEITLIGQDYSFPSNQYYSEGVTHTSDDTIRRKLNESGDWVLNVQGEQNRSNSSMLVAKQGIEQLIYMYPQCKFYNASKIGAIIENTTLQTLDELYKKYSKIDLEENWFVELMDKHCNLYSDDRKNSIRIRFYELHRKSIQFEDEMKKLVNHIGLAQNLIVQEEKSRLTNWLIQFENIWKPIVDDETFKYVYGFYLQRELNYIDRNWIDMLEIYEVNIKVSMLVNIINPFIEAWEEVAPILRTWLDNLMGWRIMQINAPLLK